MRICVVDVGEVVDLRHRVLRAGMVREAAIFLGDEAEDSVHFAAYGEDGRVVGCLTLHLNEWEGERAYQVRGMAADAGLQRRGVGRELMKVAEGFVVGKGVRVMWCNARVPAVGFYERVGWRVVSGEFEVPTAGLHVRMVWRG